MMKLNEFLNKRERSCEPDIIISEIVASVHGNILRWKLQKWSWKMFAIGSNQLHNGTSPFKGLKIATCFKNVNDEMHSKNLNLGHNPRIYCIAYLLKYYMLFYYFFTHQIVMLCFPVSLLLCIGLKTSDTTTFSSRIMIAKFNLLVINFHLQSLGYLWRRLGHWKQKKEDQRIIIIVNNYTLLWWWWMNLRENSSDRCIIFNEIIESAHCKILCRKLEKRSWKIYRKYKK